MTTPAELSDFVEYTKPGNPNSLSTSFSQIKDLVAGPGGGDLLATNNLSDVANIDTSRQNLLAPKTSVHAGDPNSAVAGQVGDFCINTSSSNALYMCTTAGDAASAVWTLQGGGAGGLLATNNLSDVANIDTSRQNLLAPKITISEGNPNGNVAGTHGDFCLNVTANFLLYRCIITGDAVSASWVLTTPDLGTATLSSGTAIVSYPGITASSNIFLTAQDDNTIGSIRVSSRTPGAGFTITSTDATDSGIISYQVFDDSM